LIVFAAKSIGFWFRVGYRDPATDGYRPIHGEANLSRNVIPVMCLACLVGQSIPSAAAGQLDTGRRGPDYGIGHRFAIEAIVNVPSDGRPSSPRRLTDSTERLDELSLASAGAVLRRHPRIPTMFSNAGQTSARPSKRDRIIAGALIGFGVGAVLGVTVGQEACLGGSKWGCIAQGGGFGAAMGILIARR
jgi:hypothetical protein